MNDVATNIRKRPFADDSAALDAACKLIVQAWRSKAPQLEHLAATVIHNIEQRARGVLHPSERHRP